MAELESIRRMPYFPEGEKAILGTIIMDPKRYDDVSSLKKDDFFLPQHQQIFEALTQMYLDNKQVDLVTLIATLTQMGSYTEGDAGKYIMLLADLATSASNIEEYAKIVHGKAILRMLIEATREISDQAYSEVGAVSDILNNAQTKIAEVADQTYGQNFEHVKSAIIKNYDTLALLKQDPNALMGLRTN